MTGTDDEDAAELAANCVEGLFDALIDEQGLCALDVISGMHGELMRRIIMHLGFKEAEKYLCLSLKMICELSDKGPQSAAFELLHSTPLGSA